ncbi:MULTISPECIES: Crp/Fnr family transcriptional regulator [Maribellus]|uniref:Helix-turn-helix domain-containing protein n=1 Tax=Maribellus comscasis TaxID=2681766 RepID=A0A6I6JS90_9BACT|nr:MULTISPECIES: Crp/Fnr family transcriptional regulator [Maribellus]MCG6190224.1 Crp/Fnr family transcriptional regulator [Maribellus maritimus]QGY43938.1 helix-turn-helix domain-containing protein [Maribellus comscasis]
MQQLADFSLISQCPVFRGISENEIMELLNKIHFQIKRFNKEEIVAYAGDTVQNLYILLSGSVKGEMIDYSGKTIKIEDVEASKPLASAFLFGKENKFPVTVTALVDLKILAIPVPEFLKVLQMNTQVLKNYLNSISTRTQFLSQKLHFLSFKTIREKVAHFLLTRAEDKFHSIELKNTQQQLADLFGVTRPSLARIFGEMQKEGLIKIERKTVTLLNKEKLNELLING